MDELARARRRWLGRLVSWDGRGEPQRVVGVSVQWGMAWLDLSESGRWWSAPHYAPVEKGKQGGH